MNEFMQSLDDHLNTVFYDTDKFGIEFTYYRNGSATAETLRGIFDSDPFNSPIDSSDANYIDTRPTLRMRQSDLDDGKPHVKTDVFVIDSVSYKCDNFLFTRTGETILKLLKV